MRIVLLLFIVLISCSVTKEKENNKIAGTDSIVFAVLSISKNSANTKNTITLIRKTKSSGKMKKQNQSASHYENYLSISVYENKALIDTLIIEHPLYKHFEYLDENNAFSTKDTVLDNAEFFIRFQTQGHASEIKILEILKNKSKKELTTIKL
jgi:hypothetical protein